MTTLYISPTGSGTGDGSSWANAAKITQLSSMVDKAGPGGTVLLRADQGAYNVTVPITINQGGDNGAPVTVRGADASGQPMNVEIVGTRDIAAGVNGAEVFRLMNGADNLTFENMVFRDVGNGAFRIGADLHDLTIRHVDAYNVQRFIENYASGTNVTATVSNLLVQDVEVHGYSKGAIRLQYDSHDIVIQDVLGDSEKQMQDDFAIGVLLDGTTHNVVLRGVTMANNWNTNGTYWNGDGFATERGVYAVRFENTRALGNTDAGYDLKSSNTVLDNAYAEGNKKNFRFWGDDVTVVNSTGVDPHKWGGSDSQSQVWLATGATVTIKNSTFTSHDPATTTYDLSQGGATLTIAGNTVTMDPMSLLQRVYAGSIITEIPLTTTTTATVTTTIPEALAIVEPAPAPVVVEGVTIDGSSRNDTITGKEGADTLRGYGGNDTISGGGGADSVLGGSGHDRLTGGAGADFLDGNTGYDRLFGEDGDDVLSGGADNDILDGGAGDDLLKGGKGADNLAGGVGSDTLRGEDGADTLNGGGGGDHLYGGYNADLFVFGSGSGQDVVHDFQAGVDHLRLEPGVAVAGWTQAGADLVLALSGSGDSITLLNVKALSGGSIDWLFA